MKLVIFINLSYSFLIIFWDKSLTHCVTHMGLDFIAIPLSQLPECSDYRRSQLTIFYRLISSANGSAVISFQNGQAFFFFFEVYLGHYSCFTILFRWNLADGDLKANKTEAPHAP